MGLPAPSAGRVIIAGDSKDGRNEMQIAILGIDLGKNNCSLVGLDGRGAVVKRRRMRRASLASPKVCRLASSRWRPAAAPIISVIFSWRKVGGPAYVAGICAALRQGAR
jgi:hypothetical protein